MTDPTGAGAAESVHSAGVSAHISHAVIAAYAAAAAREVDGVHALTGGGHLGRLERRGDPERVGVRVASAGDAVDLELHLVTAWGASIPAVAAGVERSVRSYLAAMVDLDVRSVAVVVDDVAPAAR